MTHSVQNFLKVAKPRVPDGVRIYAVGDIHGRADLLERVLKSIDGDLKANPIPQSTEVFLGDYVDRGPASRTVLDLLVARSRTHHAIFLKGNHETYLTDFLTDPSILEDWQHLGGLATLTSYRINAKPKADAAAQKRMATAFDRALPENHRQFLKSLKLTFICGDFLFVHAGIRPGVPLGDQAERDLLWIREDFLRSDEKFEKFVVHGHSPVPQPDSRPNRINIDTGAFATGRLTCLKIEGDQLSFL